MKGLAKILFIIASIAYPFIILGGLMWFKAPPRLLATSLIVIVALNFVANSGDARKGGFTAWRFWAISVILTVLILLILLTNNYGLVKAYPVLMNLFLLSGFAWTLWHPPTMIYRFASLQDKTIAADPDRSKIELYCRRVTICWCGFFIFNTIVAIITALWTSEMVWSLYNGLISYCLIGGLLLGEMIFRHYWKKA